MFRIALTALAIYLLWALLRWAFGWSRRTKPAAEGGKSLGAAEMVACTGCGTFVVRADSVRRGGKDYCSESCAQK
jgi:hypothetical protein